MIAIVGLLIVSVSVQAASSLQYSPAKVSVSSSQTFTVLLSVNPQTTKDYTVRANLRFPSDLVSVQSFSLSPGWIAVSQDGYDSIDNTNGEIIKTAGFPKGITSLTSFGTVTFRAKKAGTGVISTGSKTLILDATNANAMSGSPSVEFTIVDGTPRPVTVSGTSPSVTQIGSAGSPGITATPTSTLSPSIAPQTASIFAGGMGWWFWFWALIFLAIGYLIGRAVYKKDEK